MNLAQQNISATYIDTELHPSVYMPDILSGKFKLIYITPEKALNSTHMVREMHEALGIGLCSLFMDYSILYLMDNAMLPYDFVTLITHRPAGY